MLRKQYRVNNNAHACHHLAGSNKNETSAENNCDNYFGASASVSVSANSNNETTRGAKARSMFLIDYKPEAAFHNKDKFLPGQKCFHSSIGCSGRTTPDEEEEEEEEGKQPDDNVFKTPTKDVPDCVFEKKTSKFLANVSKLFSFGSKVENSTSTAVRHDAVSNEYQSSGHDRSAAAASSNQESHGYNNNNNNTNGNKKSSNGNKKSSKANKNNNNTTTCFSNKTSFLRGNSVANSAGASKNSTAALQHKHANPSSTARTATSIRKIWRFRLGSSGDRVTTSPPRISHNDIKKIRLKKLIGYGGFGAVYLGVYKDKIVAVKKLHKHVKNARAKIESFRAECNVLNLKHPNIVQVLAASIGDPSQEAVIVMEYAGERNLLSVINDSKQVLDFPRRAKYSLEITKALQFIHSNRVAHLDLKPANVIITSRDVCKLGDFGCCRLMRPQRSQASSGGGASLSATDDKASPSPDCGDYSCSLQGERLPASQLAGTYAYRAPELLKGDAPSPKSDVYSLGITMWQMLSRRTPYAGKDRHVIIFGVVAYNVRPSFDFNAISEEDEVSCLLSVPNSNSQQLDSTNDYGGLRVVATGGAAGAVCHVSNKSTSAAAAAALGSAQSSAIEKQYREVVESCWSDDQATRPWPFELIKVFQRWLGQFG